MRISIFGLGYVGSVSAACLANKGYQVIGVDANQEKVNLMNQGKASIIEPELEIYLTQAVNNNTLQATTQVTSTILTTDLSFICVGTPCHPDGSLDLTYITAVTKQIALALKEKHTPHILVYRSTMFPGSMTGIVIPLLENISQKKYGKDFSVCFNPEFMMEGSAIYDYTHPPKNVIGTDDQRAIKALSELNQICTHMPTTCVDFTTAEFIKYCDNIWHALKVGFANEIGKMCKALQIDSHRVMDIFCSDTKLNISTHYLKPGFAFGGSCLPKDLRAFLAEAKKRNIDLPILNAVLPSNHLQIEHALQLIEQQQNKKIGILGLSFKANTDDLRESPTITMVEHLLKKGYELILYDKNIALAKNLDINKDYFFNKIPHITQRMVNSMSEVLDQSETIVITNKEKQFSTIFDKLTKEQVVIDLVRIMNNPPNLNQYNGICW